MVDDEEDGECNGVGFIYIPNKIERSMHFAFEIVLLNGYY